MKKRLEKKVHLRSTLNALEKSREEKKSYKVEFFEKKFIVFPDVFSPKYFDDTKFFGAFLPDLIQDKRLLEMGVGTGVLSVLCALNGAKVIGIDINPQAVKNTKQNARLHKCHINTRLGDLFSPLKNKEKFDFIFWNHPFTWSSKSPKDTLEKAVIDKEYKNLEKFFTKAKKHLSPNGKVLLGTSSLATLGEIKRLAKKTEYKIKLILKSEKEFLEADHPIDLRIYELAPHVR